MIRALLVDDEAPARARLTRLLSDHPDVTCVGEAGDGVTALTRIEELRPDVVFLDIQMPELDGLATAAALPAGGPAIVFATAFDEHAVRAFDLAAVDYLLKPIKKDRLAAALDRVRQRATPGAEVTRALLAHLKPTTRKMAVRSGSKYVVFDVDRVAAVLAQDHYACLLVDGRELLSDDSLEKLVERLDPAQFLRVHRSAVVNLAFVRELVQEGDRKYVAVLSDPASTRVPISRERLDEVKRRVGIG